MDIRSKEPEELRMEINRAIGWIGSKLVLDGHMTRWSRGKRLAACPH